jgi:hypothetical protein
MDPWVSQALQLVLTQLTLELPLLDRLAHLLTGGGIFAGFAAGLSVPICSPVKTMLILSTSGMAVTLLFMGKYFSLAAERERIFFCFAVFRTQFNGVRRRLL